MRQRWDAGAYARHARFVSDLGVPLLELLAARPRERILDLGCGDGALTAKLGELGCSVVGIDSSPEMVAAARARGVDARLIDAEALPFEAEFDAVFSNAALHWMKRPDAVLDGVWRALRPGGRFVGEFGGQGNVATAVAALSAVLDRMGIDLAAIDPWYFPSAQEYRARLEARGFEVQEIALFDRPTPLPTGLTGWLETFFQPYLNRIPAAERPRVLEEVAERCRPRLYHGEDGWVADYVRLRFVATRPWARSP